MIPGDYIWIWSISLEEARLLNSVQFYQSDFGMIPARPPIAPTIMDGRWVLVQHGVEREAILQWSRVSTRTKLISRLRIVAPGFMNRAMRNAQRRRFMEKLEHIYNHGSTGIFTGRTQIGYFSS